MQHDPQTLSRIFKALGDPTRLEILRLLGKSCGDGCRFQDGSTVSEIADRFGLALSTVSHHLKELRGAGLIVCEKKGRWVCCSTNFEALERLQSFLRWAVAGSEPSAGGREDAARQRRDQPAGEPR